MFISILDSFIKCFLSPEKFLVPCYLLTSWYSSFSDQVIKGCPTDIKFLTGLVLAKSLCLVCQVLYDINNLKGFLLCDITVPRVYALNDFKQQFPYYF